MSSSRVDKLLKNTIFCLLLLFANVVFSQDPILETTINKDTLVNKTEAEVLKISNEYISKKQYDEAAIFISKHYHNFSESSNLNWLYAHVLYLINDKRLAQEKFEKAIALSPSNKKIQTDYARFLYETGKINKAEIILNNFMDDDSKDTEFLMMQANISYWNGNLKNAQNKIDRIQKIYPNTDITKSLSNQIKEYRALYIKTNFEYQSDSQPLDYIASHIVLGKNYSPFLNPQLEISQYRFSPQIENTSIVKIKNQILFNKIKLYAEVIGGIYVNYSGNSDWVGGINFTKKIIRNTSLKLGYEKNSLLSTIASTAFNLTQQDVFGELNYNNKYIVFQGGYYYKFFKDDNFIKSVAAYVISQPIKIRKFNFQFGYGYGFSDARNILFVYNANGLGVYDPYFTPKEQEIHSGLFIANYKPIEKLSIQAKVTYGLKATLRNPYPIQLTAADFEIGGFYDETFSPLELSGEINYVFSKSLSVSANYLYQETFFYNRDNINLGLNYTF